MNRILALSLLLLSIGGAIAYYQSNKTIASVKNDAPKILDESFDITLQIDKVDNDHYNLAVTIELDSGSYVISPYSKDTIYGHFNISIADASNLIPDDTLLEIPPSVEEFDPILSRPVKFVRVNTTYKQKVRVVAQNDFEVSGLIWFVLEPRCIPYDVEFIISYHSGVMKIKKTKTSISKGYKQ